MSDEGFLASREKRPAIRAAISLLAHGVPDLAAPDAPPGHDASATVLLVVTMFAERHSGQSVGAGAAASGVSRDGSTEQPRLLSGKSPQQPGEVRAPDRAAHQS